MLKRRESLAARLSTDIAGNLARFDRSAGYRNCVALQGRWLGQSSSGGKVSEETRRRQRMEFWAALILSYLVAFGVTIYAWLT
jgi:hypothetical protein